MKDEYIEKALSTLSDISKSLEPASLVSNWEFWGLVVSSVTAIVLLITAIAIWKQAVATRQSVNFLEYQIRPAAYPLLLRMGDKTILYVRNDSKIKVLFNFRIKSKEGDQIIQDFRDQPLNVFPGSMQYPNALLELDNGIDDGISKTFKIEYKMSLANFQGHEFSDYPIDQWEFKNNKWIGPDGISSQGIESLIK